MADRPPDPDSGSHLGSIELKCSFLTGGFNITVNSSKIDYLLIIIPTLLRISAIYVKLKSMFIKFKEIYKVLI